MGCVCCGGASEAEKAIRTGIDSFVGAIVELEIEAKGDLLGDIVPVQARSPGAGGSDVREAGVPGDNFVSKSV